MNTVFVDRESSYPNRYRVIPESGNAYHIVLERDDEPVTPGTPLNAETFNGMLDEISKAFAPVGYGYGGMAIGINHSRVETDEQLSEALTPIFNGMAIETTKMISWYGYPSGGKERWFGVLSKATDTNGSLLVNSVYKGNTVLAKSFLDGTWLAAEFVTPPMSAGREFRTTDRWRERPVYTKLIVYEPSSFTAQSIALPHGISGLDVCISVTVNWKRTDDTPGWRQFPAVYHKDSNWHGQVDFVDSTNVKFALGTSLLASMQSSTEKVYVTLKYTKG